LIHSSLVSNLLTDLSHLLSQHKKELADHVAGAEVVQRRCAERETRADRTDTQVRERLQRQREEFQGVSNRKDNSIKKLQGKKKKLAAEVEHLRSSRKRLRGDRNRLKSLSLDSDVKLTELRGENLSLQRELAVTRAHAVTVATLTSEKASLQQRLDLLSSEITTLRKSHREAIRQIQSDTYRASRFETQERVKLESAIKAEQEERRSNAQASEAIFERLSHRASKAETDLKDAEEGNDAALKSIAYQQSEPQIQLNLTSRRAVDAESAMNMYRTNLTAAEAENATLKGESSDYISYSYFLYQSLTESITPQGKFLS